jgi:hypothetical protein
MSISLMEWARDSWVGETIRASAWLFPMLETMHFIGLCLLFGALLIIDLRLLGLHRSIPLGAAMRFIPVAMIGLGINLVSGVAFVATDPENYWYNAGFWTKLGLVAFGGLNALYFEFAERRALASLPPDADTPTNTKIIAALSLLTWTVVLVLGRLLPYIAPSRN